MSTQASAELGEFLDPINDQVISELGLTGEAVERLGDLENGAENLQGTLDKIYSLSIVNGVGSTTTGSNTTAYAKIHGTVTVVAPPEGTWTLVARDLEKNKTVFSQQNVAANAPFPFSYSTGFKANLKFDAQWSAGGNTTLQIHILASY